MPFDLGNKVWDNFYNDLISKYSETLTTDKNWVRKHKDVKDIDSGFLEVKPDVTKQDLIRDLKGYLHPDERRHSLHYSHKRIKMLKAKKSLPINVGNSFILPHR